MIFPSLLAGINYHMNCPVCTGPMKIDGDDAELSIIQDPVSGHQKRTLTWHHDGVLTIDMDTREFSLTIKNSNQMYPVFGYTGHSGSYAGSPVYQQIAFNGAVYVGLAVNCQDCCQYGFGLKIILDTNGKGQGQITTELNSEMLSIESKGGDTVHEIKNIYPTNQTVYTCFTGSPKRTSLCWNDKTLTLPLVPLDVYDPDKTLKRIKNLVIFS